MDLIKDNLLLQDDGPPHPLTDPQEALALVQALPQGDSVALLKQVTAWLNEVLFIPGITLQRQLEVIDLIDKVAKQHQIGLVPEYLDASRMRKLSESALWNTSFSFWKALSRCYFNCLARFQAHQGDTRQFRGELPLVVCRILRTLALQIKWTAFRYGLVDDRIWRDLGHTYQLAESWGFAGKHVAVYPGAHGETSPQEELLKALMFSVSALDALTPAQQHVAERTIAYFARRFALHTEPGPGSLFSFDMSMRLPPSRSRRAASGPLVRYFGQGTALEGLRQWSDHLQAHGKLPDDTGLPPNLPRPQAQAVIDHLARCWNDAPLPRRSKRQPVLGRATVVPGLAEVLAWLEGLEGRTQSSYINASHWESWIVADTSDAGCGAEVPGQPADWLRVGALVGIQLEATRTPRLGVVRRLTADAPDRRHVGVEFLGDVAKLVHVLPDTGDGSPAADRAVAAGRPAVLVNRRPDDAGRIELVLGADVLQYSRRLALTLPDRVVKVTPSGTRERDKDYRREAYTLEPDADGR